MTATFIVTLEMDQQSFTWLNGLRRSHFPSARNVLEAHLTLFHKVDANGIAVLDHALAAEGWHDIELDFSGLISLGRGVAVAVTSPALVDLRGRLAGRIRDRLTPQDRQAFRPHVTIQNKVEPSEARALFVNLSEDFAPQRGLGSALQIWEYCDGPWRFHSRAPQSQ